MLCKCGHSRDEHIDPAATNYFSTENLVIKCHLCYCQAFYREEVHEVALIVALKGTDNDWAAYEWKNLDREGRNKWALQGHLSQYIEKVTDEGRKIDPKKAAELFPDWAAALNWRT